jgi:nicotinic acid mononucleotide adenylyltransferase
MVCIALVPGVFNPPTLEDVRVVEALLALETTDGRETPRFDGVILCLLSDGSHDGHAETRWQDRRQLLELAFAGYERVGIDSVHAHQSMGEAADDLYTSYARRGTSVTFVVSYEDITLGEDGLCVIERTWQNGTVLLARASFCVTRLHGASCLERELPSRSFYLPRAAERSLNHALVVRRLCRERASSLKDHLPPAVAEAIITSRMYGPHPVYAD